MTGVFTTFFREQLFNSLDKTAPYDYNANLMAGKSVHWVYFSTHAAFTDPQDPRYTGIKTISDLAGRTGWSNPITPQSATQVVGCSTASDTTYVLANNRFANGANFATTTVSAAVLILEGSYGGTTDPIIYLTDTPFEGGVVMHQDDGLIARPVPALAGNRSLFSWPVWFTGQTVVQPVEGSMAVLQAPPSFEAAYTQHAWLVPQRINMIANPSFETSPGTNHWRSNGTFTHVGSTPTIPSSPGGGAWYGRFVGASPLVAESNIFPLTHRGAEGDLWTIQAMVRGTGKVRVGLLGWEPDFITTYADWGDRDDYEEVWDIPASGWLHIYALRRSAENTWGMVRIECDGGEMHLDNVLCEADWLQDWRYFDGDTTYGSREDYSWYGGKNRKGNTYSCWYNHRRAVIGRLFAWDISENDFTVTDEEVQSQGFVYRWVPAGVRVAAHYDVLWPEDTQEPVPNNAGTAVTPYNNSLAWLNPEIGQVSTPHTADMNLVNGTKYRLTYKGKLDLPVWSYVFFVNKQGATRDYLLGTVTGNNHYYFTTQNESVGMTSPVSYGVDHTIGIEFTPGSTAAVEIFDGVRINRTWGQVPVFSNAGAVQVGEATTNRGRIDWVKLEQLDGSGNVVATLWKFDPNDYPGTGTVYTDPRGRVWTLTNANAITPKTESGVINPWL